MSAQPLNTEISIYRTARSQRTRIGTDAVAVLIKHLRSLVMVIPGQEIMCGVLTRDPDTADFSPYCGQAAAGLAGSVHARGFPIVFGLYPQLTLSQTLNMISDVDFPFVIGQDQFLENTAAGLSGDLYGELRALNTTYSIDGTAVA